MSSEILQPTGSIGANSSPIAIVGMSCRLPGGATSISKLWDLLVQGESGQCAIPISRFNGEAFYHPSPHKAGYINNKGGYFLENDIHLFDNNFFGINNLEAKYMDPQQRQLLEVVFECLESGGVTLEEISGANVGCYVANFTADFVNMQARSPESYHRYSATGFGPTILANRISHCFNLKGPSLVVDTACSSSIYALHMACATLNAGECDAAIVAGANLIQSPEAFIAMAKAGVLSTTSTSHTFDSAADGYGRGEGVVALYLKRVERFLKDGDHIRSVIRGTAVNSNGYTPGITLPSASGQKAVIRKAYKMASLPIKETVYIETHGTGTPIGDPIEVEEISRCFASKTTQPLLIGSVKPNLGHGEAVSGLSSVIKAALALENMIIPPTIGISNLNPELKLGQRNIKIVTTATSWPQKAIPRVSVNSFGYGGANAHAIIESATLHVNRDSGLRDVNCGGVRDGSMNHRFILPFSAHSAQALTKNIENILAINTKYSSLQDLSDTLCTHRSALPVRGYLLASVQNSDVVSTSTLRIQMPHSAVGELPFGFIFTGQGAQWPGMGHELLSRFPTFLKTIQHLDQHLNTLSIPPQWTIEGTILDHDHTSLIHLSSRSQPIRTAIQIALVELLREWNVKPTAVIGHSSGEICAAFAAGFLTKEEAIAVAYYRGLAVSTTCLKGAMMAVGLAANTVSTLIREHKLDQHISIACFNSPDSTTISGEPAALDTLLEDLRNRDVFVGKLKTDDKAYHSAMMGPAGQTYEDFLASTFSDHQASTQEFENSQGKVSMFSSVTSQIVADDVVGTPKYWRKNLESPVLFHSAMQLLYSTANYQMIEIGPHPVLGQAAKAIYQTISDSQLNYTSTLSRGKDSEAAMLDLAGTLYLQSYQLPLHSINHLQGLDQSSVTLKSPKIHNLPTYAWDHQSSNFFEPRASEEYRNRKHRPHDLLGYRIAGIPGDTIWWRNKLAVQDVHWLQGHKLGQTVVFPAAGYLAMIIEALQQSYTIPLGTAISFRQVHIQNMLVLPSDKDGVELSTRLDEAKLSTITPSTCWWRFEISSRVNDNFVVHAAGAIGFQTMDLALVAKTSSRQLFAKIPLIRQDPRKWYNKLANEGLVFGTEFQSMVEIETDRNQSAPYAIIQTIPKPLSDQESPYLIHPITIDCILQAAIISSSTGVIGNLHGRIPVMIGELDIFIDNCQDSASICKVYGSSEEVGFESLSLSGLLENSRGGIMAQLKDVHSKPFVGMLLDDQSKSNRNPILRVLWKPDLTALFTTDNGQKQLNLYLESFAGLSDSHYPSNLAYLSGVVDLVAHQKGKMNVLEIGEKNYGDSSVERSESANTYTNATILSTQKAVDSLHGTIDDANSSTLQELEVRAPFDLILIKSKASAQILLQNRSDTLLKHLASDGILLFTNDCALETLMDKTRFTVLSVKQQVSEFPIHLARSLHWQDTTRNEALGASTIIIVCDDVNHPLNRTLQASLTERFHTTTVVMSLNDVVPQSIHPDQFKKVQIISENTSLLLWITNGRLFKGQRPDFSLVAGLSRTMMLERPSLRMPILDLDNGMTETSISCQHIAAVLQQILECTSCDLEYRQYNGTLYCSRLVPDPVLNQKFRDIEDECIEQLPIQNTGNFQLAMRTIGQIDTVHFKEKDALPSPRAGYLNVEVKAVGINAKDYYALSDRIAIKAATRGLEFSGIVVESGTTKSEFLPGDRVVVMAPNHFSTFECVPEWACCKLRDDENLTLMSTMPIAFSTALYALEDRAHLKPGESVLIHSAAGGVGIASIQIAQIIGAEIFATVGTNEKRQFLVEHFGIREDHIFNSHDVGFVSGIQKATNGKGVDVVLNSLTGDLLHASWKACSEFGTFVEIGKRDILENGKLDMDVFDKGATFTAFDLSALYWSGSEVHHQIWHGLMNRTMRLLRQGSIQPITPLEIFPVSEIIKAFRYFALSTRVGKVAVSFTQEATIPVVPRKYRSKLTSKKAYILVGCLGGLGRSLSRWMLQRGATNFIFMGRSGTDKEAARNLVDDLRAAGANVVVIKGSVTDYDDVKRAVSATNFPIGGVIQASMSIHVALFNEMTCKAWHQGIDQKVKGTWNLHHAISGVEAHLDFFLLLSSIAGTIGTATESNYCASNAFLDSFAAYRRSMGLPGTSLGLGMMSDAGYIHERPEVRAILLRKGVHPLTEGEFLLMLDFSLTPSSTNTASSVNFQIGAEHYMESHILTGLELYKVQEIREAGFKHGIVALEDPRCVFIANALEEATGAGAKGVELENNGDYPLRIDAVLAANNTGITPDKILLEKVGSMMSEHLASLLLTSSDEVYMSKMLSDLGMESMLAAELRTDIFRSFKVDLPFTILMDKNSKVETIVEYICIGLLEKRIDR